jgi:hypothetical protein
MKNYLRFLSAVFALVICFGLLAACDTMPSFNSNDNRFDKDNEDRNNYTPKESVPYVVPADQVGVAVAADENLITWYPYATEEENLDFKSLDIDKLGLPGEMALFYLENEVTYFILVDGKMVETTVESIVKDAVVGVTTLEQGVQEVYILSVPEEKEEEYEEVIVEDETEENEQTQ